MFSLCLCLSLKKQTNVSPFSTATYQHQHQKNLLQRSHKTSHRSRVSRVGRLWQSTLKKTELPTSKGRQINPSRSFTIYRAKDECTWSLNLLQQLTYNEAVFMHNFFNNNSPNYSLIIGPTTQTPGITSTCQGQGLPFF